MSFLLFFPIIVSCLLKKLANFPHPTWFWNSPPLRSQHWNFTMIFGMRTSTSVFGDWRISTHADPMYTRRANLIGTSWSHQPEHSSSFTRWPIRPILDFWGSKVPKNVRFPAKDALQNLKPLASSSAEKSVTVQTNKQTKKTQTVNDISTPCLSACVDKKPECIEL